MEVQKNKKKPASEEIQENNTGKNTPKVDGWLPDIDLDGLDESQKEIAKQMLMEESDSFARNDDDIGCIDELQMRINLSDDTPVQKTYRPIAKPLYQEVKQYVEDLLNRRWIRKSKSAYSSPVVCVR